MAEELKYTEEHEWLSVDGDVVSIGITEYAQEALGELVYVELPEVGDRVEKGGDFAVVESVKVASEVYSPVAGEIIEVNSALEDEPNDVKKSIEEGWIVKIKVDDASALDGLMTKKDYTEFLENLDD